MIGTSEAAAVRVLAYLLSGEAKDVHAEQFGLVELDFEADKPVTSDHGSWTHVIHALLRRFLSDDVLREAHDAVSRAEQRETEDEGEFAERISKAARLCRHVFSKDELIKYYVQGLKNAVLQMVSRQVRQMKIEERQSISALSQVACEMGREQRALIRERRRELRTSIDLKERPKWAVKPVMMMKSAPMDAENRSFEPIDPCTLNSDGKSIIDVAMELGSILIASTTVETLKMDGLQLE